MLKRTGPKTETRRLRPIRPNHRTRSVVDRVHELLGPITAIPELPRHTSPAQCVVEERHCCRPYGPQGCHLAVEFDPYASQLHLLLEVLNETDGLVTANAVDNDTSLRLWVSWHRRRCPE